MYPGALRARTAGVVRILVVVLSSASYYQHRPALSPSITQDLGKVTALTPERTDSILLLRGHAMDLLVEFSPRDIMPS